MISGWAVDPNAIYRYKVAAAFPLSDHADYNDLIRYVDLVRPKRVLTLHGFASEFARDLRDCGIDAWALTGENELELTLGTFRAAAKTLPPATTTATKSEFADFAEVGDSIDATPRKLEKVRLLPNYL